MDRSAKFSLRYLDAAAAAQLPNSKSDLGHDANDPGGAGSIGRQVWVVFVQNRIDVSTLVELEGDLTVV